ncbi:PAS domain S-box protein [Zavarzinella formosa]|uniref:PAS domain S-box protein n=1 Tax=Zavarzinella formosa TaxID=360055 RepID=UPI00030AD582|nr:PAS domain S-box protein [Zavarzinella formosa]
MRPTLLSTASEQARIAQLFMHVRDGVVMLDPIGVVGFWSDGAAELHNRPAPDALGRCYLELIPARTIAIQLPLIQRAIDGEEASGEWQMTRSDGVTLWVEADFRPLCDDYGRRIGCVILLHDVTKWRAAEQAKKASEEQLRTISDNIPGAVFQFRLGKDGRKSFPFISRGVEELLELTPEETNQRAMLGEFQVIPEDLPVYWDTLDESFRTMMPWDLEFRCQTVKTGQLKWIRLRAIPAKQADGGTLWNGVMMDVSDRVFVNDALRESEARYRLLTENATDLISRINLDGEYLYVSPASHTLFGIDPEEMTGRHIRDFVWESDLPRMVEILERVISAPAIQTYAHRSLRQDGSYVWCETTARGVHDEMGNVMEVITVTRSIEERKRLEGRMQNSMKMEAVGRLAGGIAHDFNNLLTVINGFSEMILRNLNTQDPNRTAGQVREIRKAGERASALTRQLLAFGRQQIQARVRLNLNSVVTDTEKMLTRLIGEDIEIELELNPDLGFVNADMSQIEQVLMNLVVNARDAMEDGGDIFIRTGNVTFDRPPEEDAKAGEYVMIEVADTGCGMDEQTRSRIFEPFFTTKEMGKGTGLGLAMVYGIVKQSEGIITCDSEVDRGTTFRVYFPRCTAPTAEPEGRSRFGSSIMLGKETVLLAEDDVGVRNVTAGMLRTLGYQVIEAAGGLEALRLCREHHGPIHLLLTDVVMPLMNGRELADRVRAILPGIRVLFVSGYTDDSILRHGVLDENVAFLNKPLSHESLSRKVREVLEPVSLHTMKPAGVAG